MNIRKISPEAQFDESYIKELESEGHIILKDYIKFLKENNGVYVNGYPVIKYEGKYGQTDTDLSVIFGIGIAGGYNLRKNNENMNLYLPKEGVNVNDYIIIGEDSGGNGFLLGTKNDKTGYVYIYEIDSNEIFFVERSFAKFVENLYKY